MPVRLLLVIIAVGTLCSTSSAATPTVESVYPSAGQRGSVFTLTLRGRQLNAAQELLLYSAGIRCTRLEAKSEREVIATLEATSDCKIGLHAFRLRTPTGISEIRTFAITRFPVVLEAVDHGSRETAQKVELNTTISGIIESGDRDYYAVVLQKGQRLTAEVEGIRLGVGLTDNVITVYGPDGKELATVDDTALFRQDPFVSLLAPEEGNYTIEVRDTTAGGGPNNAYLLHVGTFPRPTAIFPPGGEAGTEIALTMLGSAEGEQTTLIQLPKEFTTYELFPTDPYGTAPTAHPFRISPFPNVNEVEPNEDFRKIPAAVAWPVAFNGILAKDGDIDHFRFRAQKGDAIAIQAYASRIGTPVDTIVEILDSHGSRVAINDDDTTHDSALQLTIPTDGEYIVRVSDKRHQGGPGFIYRIELDRPQRGLTVFAPERTRKSQDRQVIAIPRGNRVMAYLAVRRDDVAGPVSLRASELPTGVKVDLGTIPADEYLLPVVFEADADAPLGGRLVSIMGTCQVGENCFTGGFVHVVPLVRGPGDSAIQSLILDRLIVAVVEESPLHVSVSPPTTPLATDGTLEITVRVERTKDFTDAVEVTFPTLPPGVEAPTTVLIPPEKDEATVTLVASPEAEVGDWKLIAEATIARPGRAGRDPLLVGMNGLGTLTPGGRPRRAVEGITPVASAARTMKVAEAPLKASFPSTVGEPGKTVQVICQLEANSTVPGRFTAKLDGLPPRATAASVEIAGDAKMITFTVTIDPTTPLGEHRTLVCELAGVVAGQKVVYRTGRGGLLKIDPPGAAKTDATGKPLSPLEALRQQEKK